MQLVPPYYSAYYSQPGVGGLEALPMIMMMPMMFMMLPMMMILPLMLIPLLTSALQPQQQTQQQQSGFNLVELLQGLWNAVPYVLTILALVGAIHAFM